MTCRGLEGEGGHGILQLPRFGEHTARTERLP